MDELNLPKPETRAEALDLAHYCTKRAVRTAGIPIGQVYATLADAYATVATVLPADVQVAGPVEMSGEPLDPHKVPAERINPPQDQR